MAARSRLHPLALAGFGVALAAILVMVLRQRGISRGQDDYADASGPFADARPVPSSDGGGVRIHLQTASRPADAHPTTEQRPPAPPRDPRTASHMSEGDARVSQPSDLSYVQLREDMKSLRDQVAVLTRQVERLANLLEGRASADRPPAPLPAWDRGSARPGEGGQGQARADARGGGVAPPESAHGWPPARLTPLPGALSSEDDRVRLAQTSSRPMVEIYWQEGTTKALVGTNPDYKFAEASIDVLDAAFDLDGREPGAYRTVKAAVVEWGPDATAGRVITRGRVRPLHA